jgi:hypothetical protein
MKYEIACLKSGRSFVIEEADLCQERKCRLCGSPLSMSLPSGSAVAGKPNELFRQLPQRYQQVPLLNPPAHKAHAPEHEDQKQPPESHVIHGAKPIPASDHPADPGPKAHLAARPPEAHKPAAHTAADSSAKRDDPGESLSPKLRKVLELAEELSPQERQAVLKALHGHTADKKH